MYLEDEFRIKYGDDQYFTRLFIYNLLIYE